MPDNWSSSIAALKDTGPFVAILLFFAAQIVGGVVVLLRRNVEKKRLVRAIFSEIVYNCEGLRVYSIKSTPQQQTDAREKLIGSPDFRPHVIYAVHTNFYAGNVNHLGVLHSEVIAALIAFYNDLETLRADAAGFNLPSFTTISPEGRAEVFRLFTAGIADTSIVGSRAIVLMHDNYAAYFRGFTIPKGVEFGRASAFSNLTYYIERLRLEIKEADKAPPKP